MSLHDLADNISYSIGHNVGWIIYGAILGVGKLLFIPLDIHSPALNFLVAIGTAGAGGAAAVIGKNIAVWMWKKLTKKKP